MNLKPTLRYLVEIVGLAIVYHLAARLGLQMAYVQQNTSPVWPPSGIALAALLLFGIRDWPGITLGVVVGSLLTGAPLNLSLGFGIANTLEALISASLLKRVIQFDLGISQIRDVIGLGFASACGTAVSATIGVATLALTQNIPLTAFLTLWVTWFIGNLLGCLVITPLLLTWIRVWPQRTYQHWNKARLLEAAVFLALLILVSVYVFGNPSGAGAFHQALIYAIFPFAIWAALRMQQVGAASTTFVVSGIAIWGTIHGLGPFANMPIIESLVLLQTFTGIVAIMSLTLAASANERSQADSLLHKQLDELAALNDASRQFLENIDKQALYESICRLAVERFNLSAAWIELAASKSQSPVPIASYPAGLPLSSAELQGQIQAVERSHQPAALAINREVTGPSQAAVQSLAAFPLLYGKEMVGILIVASVDPGSFSKEHILLLQSYANLAAVAIQNSWLFDQVRQGNEQLHALSHRLIEVQEAERIHLSRELHDESGQILAALKVQLGLLDRDAGFPELVRAHVSELKHTASEVLDNLHSLAVKLRPASLDHLGLITALQQYIQEFNRQYNLEVGFETVGMDDSRLSGDLETSLFRIVQESLTNVALHSKASQVDVLLNKRHDRLVLTVEDNGIGFNPDLPADENRLGLFGMRERVEMLGGKLAVESSPGKGTMISVEVPCGNAHPDRG